MNWNAKKFKRVSKPEKCNDNGRENSDSPVQEDWMCQARNAAQTAKAINIFARNRKLRDAVAHSASYKEYNIMGLLIGTHCQRRSEMSFLLETDKNGKIPLHYCIESGEKDAVQKLLQAGKSHGATHHDQQLDQKMCEIRVANGEQSLHMAAWRAQPSIVNMLLAHGASKASLCITSPKYYRYGKTPLDAAFGGWQECCFTDVKRSKLFEDVIKSLLPDGNDLSDTTKKFLCAVERNSRTVVDLLKPWYNGVDAYGWPFKLLAAEYGFRIPEGDGTGQNNAPKSADPPTKWYYADGRLKLTANGLIASFDPTSECLYFLVNYFD